MYHITLKGEPLDKLPEDLYIPPGALEIILEEFEGPLDLLLYLIKKQNLDILNIPMTLITKQYMEYIALIEKTRFELAAEYLVMAAMLIEIKSHLLLPRNPTLPEEEEDPRMELARRLLEYERYKKAAINLNNLLRQERDFFKIQAKYPQDLPEALKALKPLASVSLEDLLQVVHELQERLNQRQHHQVQREPLSVSDRIEHILQYLCSSAHSMQNIPFHRLFSVHEGRMGIVVTFMAILELAKQSMIELIQGASFEPIHIRQL